MALILDQTDGRLHCRSVIKDVFVSVVVLDRGTVVIPECGLACEAAGNLAGQRRGAQKCGDARVLAGTCGTNEQFVQSELVLRKLVHARLSENKCHLKVAIYFW
jgi:hypothetical protein